MPLRSKSRDRTPLLSNSRNNNGDEVVSMSSSGTPSKRGLARRLFGGNRDPPTGATPTSLKSRSRSKQRGGIDKRSILPKASKKADPPMVATSLKKKQPKTVTPPPPPLQENAKDSKKKERPAFAIPLRRSFSKQKKSNSINPAARDPPAHNAAASPAASSDFFSYSTMSSTVHSTEVFLDNNNQQQQQQPPPPPPEEPQGAAALHDETTATTTAVDTSRLVVINGSDHQDDQKDISFEAKFESDHEDDDLEEEKKVEEPRENISNNNKHHEHHHRHHAEADKMLDKSLADTSLTSSAAAAEGAAAAAATVTTTTYEVVYARHEEQVAAAASQGDDNWASFTQSESTSSSSSHQHHYQQQQPARNNHHPSSLSQKPSGSHHGQHHAGTATVTTTATATTTTSSTTKQQQQQRPTRALLSRPFGRASLPPEIARRWVVEVSSAEWDADEGRWKYRILVQQRPERLVKSKTKKSKQPSSFTNAFTWRSLTDFMWLEQALRYEFHGGLLLPDLGIALGRALADTNAAPGGGLEEMPMEADRLRHWLSDVLNGVRGQGELLLEPPVDIIKSESMEAFLYRSSLNHLDLVWASNINISAGGEQQQQRNNGNDNMDDDDEPASFLDNLNSVLLSPLEMCVGPRPTECFHGSSANNNNDRLQSHLADRRLPVADMLSCQSRALSTAPSLDVADSFAEPTPSAAEASACAALPSLPHSSFSSASSSALPMGAIHSELLHACKGLVGSFRQSSLSALEQLAALQKQEEMVGIAWKRFALALTGLFAYEKDVEGVKLGDAKAKKKEHAGAYRKVSKAVVEDGLRVLARQKEDRAVPALQALAVLLQAHVADLSSVEPSMAVYTAAIHQWTMTSASDPTKPAEFGASRSWDGGRLKAMATQALGDMRKQAMRSFGSQNDSSSTDPESLASGSHNEQQQQQQPGSVSSRRNLPPRLLANERLLRQSLTTMCRATPIRTARMAWRYLNTEASQCALTHSAAVSLRTKIHQGASKDQIARMVKRHVKEEKEDATTESEMIKRIITLGNNHAAQQRRRKELQQSHEGGGDAGGVEMDRHEKDLVEQRQRAAQGERVHRLARERVGRWNAKLAMAIMEAVGVDDANVQVEETTRDLRMVRKHAIGLREHLGRCVEAYELLRMSIVGSNNNNMNQQQQYQYQGRGAPDGPQHIALARSAFLVEISKVFSGMYIDKQRQEQRGSKERKRSSTLSTTVLSKAGIDCSDPFGWTQPFESSSARIRTRITFTQGRVGDLAHAYFLSRDSKIDWLLQCIGDLLRDYQERIEIIEGYVYMECLGIQLEKYFNKQRAQALSAFEKKTDLTSAINVALKKRLPKLLTELRAKLADLGPEVSQTLVKETKEAHLESKEIKGKLHDLAMRRLLRAKETATERTITLMDLWAKEEELSSARELKALGETMNALEQSIGKEDLDALVYRFSQRVPKVGG